MEIFVAPFYASSCHSNLFKTRTALVTLSGIIRRIKVEFLCFSDSLLSKHSIYDKYKNNKIHNKRITHLFYRHLTYILGKHHPYNKGPETVKVRQATCTVFEKKKKKFQSFSEDLRQNYFTTSWRELKLDFSGVYNFSFVQKVITENWMTEVKKSSEKFSPAGI